MSIFERTLPPGLDILRELAADLHWSWNHASDQLWQQLDPEIWERTGNPVSVLQFTSDARLHELAQDQGFLTQLQTVVAARRRYLQEPGWYAEQYLRSSAPNPLKGIAYFSMEFGLCDALPIYAGGLGMLAGDYLKTASELGVPLIGIGLLYQEGYFHQSFSVDGWQQETYLFNDSGNLPLQPLRGGDGSWLDIETHFLCRQIRFRVWVAQVGKVKLYLLDSNHPCNQPHDRGITSKLYGGGSELRLVQEIALGICGWRLVETLGLDIDICHLNEGHAAFATLERIRSYAMRHKTTFWQALWATRAGNIFTTHTPVAAGFDCYTIELLRRYAGTYHLEMGVSGDDIIGLGRANPQDASEPFNMAWLAMRTCAFSNGVSRLHGQVSRRIFQPLFPRWPTWEVPVGHVTNGVHVPTWDSPLADELWTQAYGKERWRRDLAALKPEALDQISDAQLWQLATENRARLVDYARARLVHQWRQESLNSTQCDITHELPLDPNILTLGFARRFAEYKRPDLLLTDVERLVRLLTHHQRPVQLLIAGKAHPADEQGKIKLQKWQTLLERSEVHKHVVFIEDYDIELAQHLIQGVDVWINNPRRPWEASGTSGMKVLVNGGLNLSSLDGWWAEAYAPDLGWALGNGKEHNGEEDGADAEQLYRLLETEIAPLFYQRDSENLPRAWIKRMRASMAQLTARFSSNRMLANYLDHYYLPAAQHFHQRQHNQHALATELHHWQQRLHQHGHEIHLGTLRLTREENYWHAQIHVQLGGVSPQDIAVQVIANPTDIEPACVITLSMQQDDPLFTTRNLHNTLYAGQLPGNRAAHEFTARVIGAHPQAIIPAENPFIVWQG